MTWVVYPELARKSQEQSFASVILALLWQQGRKNRGGESRGPASRGQKQEGLSTTWNESPLLVSLNKHAMTHVSYTDTHTYTLHQHIHTPHTNHIHTTHITDTVHVYKHFYLLLCVWVLPACMYIYICIYVCACMHMCMVHMCMYVEHMYVWCHWGQKTVSDPLELELWNFCKPPCGCWESNPSLLLNLTAEPTL